MNLLTFGWIFHNDVVAVALSNAHSFAHALHKGHVCGGDCFTKSLFGQIFTVVRASERLFNYN